MLFHFITKAPKFSYAQNTLQRLAHLRPEGERDGPKLPDCSPVFFIILLLLLLLLLLLFIVRCNSQTTQATELTQKRLQIAPSILITFHIKKDNDTYDSSFKGQRQFLAALAIETVQMILNSAHYK